MNLLTLTLYCALFIFACTSLGSALVYVFKSEHNKTMHFMMSFASGVMFSASYFSLIFPSIEYSNQLNFNLLLNVCGGFLFGMIFMVITDMLVRKFSKENANIKMLFFSMTLHNIPEGMCVGVAVALCAINSSANTIANVVSLAIAIGIQNIPEGASLSLPLYKKGKTKTKSFLFGVVSGVVEPVFCIISFLFASFSLKILPFLLSFAGACMIYVSIFELLPECVSENKKITVIGTISGMLLMMVLDLCL